MNKIDLVTEEEKREVKNAILQFNKKAEIIETIKSEVDLTKVLNTKKFNFEEAESNSKWLEQDRYDVQPETEEYGVSSFLYKRNRPFNPERLFKCLDGNFMLDVVNPEHGHDHGHGEGEEEAAEEGEDGEAGEGNDEEECDEDEETEEQY